jgi:hypothetical protein
VTVEVRNPRAIARKPADEIGRKDLTMTEDTRLDNPHEATPQALDLSEAAPLEYTAGMNTAVEEPMAEPEVRTAPDAGAIHWHAQLEPGIPADESDLDSSEHARENTSENEPGARL